MPPAKVEGVVAAVNGEREDFSAPRSLRCYSFSSKKAVSLSKGMRLIRS